MFYGVLTTVGAMRPEEIQNNTEFTEKAKATEHTEKASDDASARTRTTTLREAPKPYASFSVCSVLFWLACLAA